MAKKVRRSSKQEKMSEKRERCASGLATGPVKEKVPFPQQIGRFADGFLKWAVVVAVFLLPLIVSPAGFDAFDLTKATTLYIMTILMLLVWLVKLIFLQRLEQRRTFLDLPVLFYGLAVTLATVFSSNPIMSVVGEYGRYETIQVLLAYVFIFFVANQYFSDRVWVNRLIIALFSSGLIISIYGIRQGFGWEWLADFLKRPEARSRSSLGNAVFFGGYLATVIPLYVFKFYDEGGKALKSLRDQQALLYSAIYAGLLCFATGILIWTHSTVWAVIAVIALSIAAWMAWSMVSKSLAFAVFSFVLFLVGAAGTIYAESRGAWLATFIALFYLLSVWILIHWLNRAAGQTASTKKLAVTFLKGFLVMVLAGVLFVFLINLWGARSSPGERLFQLKERLRTGFILSEGTTATRFEIWKGCIHMIADRPLLGFGPDQMIDWFPRYRTIRYTKLEGEMTMPDRAHNEVIQTGVNMGLIGLLGYLWVLSALALSVYRHLKDHYDPLVLGLSAGAIGYFFQGLFGIAIIGITSVFWVFIAVLAALVARQRIGKTERVFEISLSYDLPTSVKAILVLVLTLVAAFGIRLATLPQEADYYYFLGNYSSQTVARATQMMDWFEKAHRTNPYRNIYRQTIVSIYSERARISNDQASLNKAIKIAEDGMKINPRDEDLAIKLAESYYYASQFDSKMLDKAIKAYETTIDIDPLFVFARIQLNLLYLQRGWFEPVIENASKVLEMRPNDEEALCQLAVASENLGLTEMAYQSYLRLYNLNPNRPGIKEALQRFQ